MKPIRLIIFGGVAVAIVFAIYSVFFPPLEKVITKRLKNLAGAISATPGGNIARVANVNKIGSFFHPNVRIEVTGLGRDVSVSGRGELEQMALGARQNVDRISVRFHNISVQPGATKTNATARATVLVKINDQSDPAIQDIELEWEKEGRAWLIRSASPVETQRRLEVQ